MTTESVDSNTLWWIHNETKVDHDTLLWILNEQKAVNNISIMVFLGILSVLGFIGNLHVLVVYTKVLKPNTNYRIFVLFLACSDITACLTLIPFDILVFRFPYTFDYIYPCKIFNFFKSAVILSSGLMLVVIATERFQKICKPFSWQMTKKTAVLACFQAIVVAAFLAWPNAVFKNSSSVDLGNGTFGTECGFDNYYKGNRKKYPIVYYGFLFVIYIGLTLALIVLYVMIGRTLYKHAKMKKVQFNKKSIPLPNISDSYTRARKYRTQSNSSSTSTDQHQDSSLGSIHKHRLPGNEANNGTGKTVEIKPGVERKTNILFAITVLFTLSFLPYLILVPITFLSSTFISSLGPKVWPVYSIFRKFFYLNNMVNPFIYGFFDTRFRKICFEFYRKICCRHS